MTAHDVRHLTICAKCNALADDRNILYINGKRLHGKCFIRSHGVKAFLALPQTETDKCTLGDIGPKTMKKLLDQRQP